MAASVANVETTITGNKRMSFAQVGFDNSYPTGGLTVTPAQLGLSSVHHSRSNIRTPAGGAVSVAYDAATQKIKVNTATAEVAAGTDLSALVAAVTAYGI